MAEDEVFTPEQVSGWEDYSPHEDRVYSDEETDGWKRVSSSQLGAAFRRGVQEIPSGIAGAAVGIPAATAASAVATPFAGIPAGIAAGAGAGFATRKFQDWLLDQLGQREGAGPLSRAQEYVDKSEHPYTSFAGELAGGVAPGFGLGKGAMKLARGVGAGIGGGLEAGSEYAQGEDLDPAKIALSAGANALFAKPRGWVNKVNRPVDQYFNPENYQRFQTQGDPYGPEPPQRPRRGLPPPSAGNRPPQDGTVLGPNEPDPWQPGGPKGPRLRRPQIESSGDTFVEHDPYEFHQKLVGDEFIDKDLEFAQENINKYANEPEMQKYWQAYKDQMIASRGKNNPEIVQDASQGKGPAFAPEDSKSAPPWQTLGNAQAQPKFSVPSAGNPMGAPMLKRVGARPSEPGRNYTKDIDLSSSEYKDTTPKVTQGQFSPDLVSALVRDKPQSTFQQQTVQPPTKPAAQPAPQQGSALKEFMHDEGGAGFPRIPFLDRFKKQQPETSSVTTPRPANGLATQPEPQGPALRDLIEEGIRRASARPIIPVRLQEGANSSKNIAGPVYMSPDVHPAARKHIAVHETVEGMLMSRGYGYDQAHKIATEAEKQSVERAGLNWDKYEHKVDHDVEQARSEPQGPQPTDKHVSTEVALRGSEQPTLTPAQQIVEQAKQRAAAKIAARPPKPVTAAVTVPKAQAAPPSKKAYSDYTPEDIRGVLAQNPDAFAYFAKNQPDLVKEVLAGDPKFAKQILEDHPDLAEDLAPMVKAARDAVNYDPANDESKRLSPADLRRFKNGHKNVKGAVDSVAPQWAALDQADEFDRPGLIALARDLADRMSKGNDGKHPFKKAAGGYRPHKLYPTENMHFGVGLSAWDVARKANEENVQNFDNWMRAYMDKNEDAARALQDQRKEDADLQRNKRKVEINDDVMTKVDDADALEGERRYLPKFSGEGESRADVEAHDRLRDWVNGLSDNEHEKLATHDPDFVQTVEGTQQPREVLADYMAALDTSMPREGSYQGKKVLYPEGAGFDAVAPEDVPGGKRTEVKSAKDLPDNLTLDDMIKAAVETENPSVMDRLKDFFKDNSGSVPAPPKAWNAEAEAAKYIKAYKGDLFNALRGLDSHPWWSRPEGIERIAAVKNALIEAVPDSEIARVRKIEQDFQKENGQRYSDYYATVFGSKQSHPKGLSDWAEWFDKQKANLKALFSDESGSAATDKLFGHVMDKMHKLFSEPAQPSSMDDYAKLFSADIGGRLVRMRNRMSNFKVDLDKVATQVMATPAWTKDRARKIYEAGERGEISKLPLADRDIWNKHFAPLQEQYGKMYDELKQIMLDHNLYGANDMPSRRTLGAGFMSWMPRVKKGQLWEDKAAYDALDPKPGETLSPFAETAQPRAWFTAVGPNGERLTFHIGDKESGHEGKGLFMVDGKARGMIDKENIGQVGAKFRMKRKGTLGDWTVDHANVAEIEKATGEPDSYHKDPFVAMSDALSGLNSALERARVYRDIVDSDWFKNNMTTDPRDARIDKHKWIKTNLPDFKDAYMPRQLAWVLDDYRKPGLGLEGRPAQWADRLAMSGTKLFYFLGPGIHMLNEADKWMIGRGWEWLNPSGYGRLAKTMSKAVKSVNAQDEIQKEMIENGANPMWAHTFVQRFMPNLAEKLGEEIKRNPKAWDPFFKAFGIEGSEAWQKSYNASTRMMWKFSDYLLTQRYLEMRDMGYTPREAVTKAHDFIDSYVMPSHFGQKGGNLGRFAKMGLSDPKLSLFGPYHYGIFHTWANMTKKLLGPNASPKERFEAAGHFAMAGAMLAVLYPAMSSLYQSVTGDKHSEFETRGASRLADTLKKVGSGEQGFDAAARNIWTPSVPVDTLLRAKENKDFAGQKILEPGKPGKWPIQGADFAANQWLSPVKPVFNEAIKGDKGHPVRKAIESQTGLKTKTPEAVKFEAKRPQREAAEARRRQKKPGGLFEYFWNKTR